METKKCSVCDEQLVDGQEAIRFISEDSYLCGYDCLLEAICWEFKKVTIGEED